MKTRAELKESGIITEEESAASKSELSDQLVQDETTVASSNTTEDITPEDIKCPKCGSEMKWLYSQQRKALMLTVNSMFVLVIPSAREEFL